MDWLEFQKWAFLGLIGGGFSVLAFVLKLILNEVRKLDSHLQNLELKFVEQAGESKHLSFRVLSLEESRRRRAERNEAT